MSRSDGLADVIPLFGPRRPRRGRRRSPLDEPIILRLHVSLDESVPQIWRRLDIRSDATLADVHAAVQAAFAWEDYHLYRFALGGSPFDLSSDLFSEHIDAAEHDEVACADHVRLDEVLQEPNESLRYVYDFGDAWELTLVVEETAPAGPDTPVARCTGGARGAPPEDSGGAVDGESLARILDDPDFFDITAVNHALGSSEPLAADPRLDPRVADLIDRLPSDPRRRLLTRLAILGEPTVPTESELAESFRSVRWFLDQAADDGIELTQAGYLKPADVTAICAILPDYAGWQSRPARENSAAALEYFRQTLVRIGLLRKTKGHLVLTRIGAGVRTEPLKLFEHIATRLIPLKAPEFQSDATIILLAIAATNDNSRFPWAEAANYMGELGWADRSFRPVSEHALYHFTHNPLPLLVNIAPGPYEGLTRYRLRPVALELVRTTLLPGT